MKSVATPFDQDPYLACAAVTSYTGYALGVKGRRHFLVELKDNLSEPDLDRIQREHSSLLFFGDSLADSQVVSALLDEAARRVLVRSPYVERVQLAHAHATLRSAPRRPKTAQLCATENLPDTPLASQETLLVVIDDGCPFAHGRLRDASGGTRVRAIWDQDDDPDFGGLSKLLSYGAVIEKKTLDECIDRATHGGLLDERRCYDLAGYGAVHRRGSHGSAILGYAAGAQKGSNGSPPILFVQLPRSVTAKGSFASLSRCIIDGIRWALSRREAAKKIVVCAAYESWLGPHDGTSLFERGLDRIIASARRKEVALSVVLPIGNNYESGARSLARSDEHGMISFTLRLLPAGESWTYIEFWSKHKHTLTRVSLNGRVVSRDDSSIYRGATLSVAGSNFTTLVRINPTHALSINGAKTGDWCFEFQSDVADAEITGYVGRAIGGIQAPLRGQQSYFVPKPTFTGTNEFNGTLSGFASGLHTAIVGAVNGWSPQSAARYSASGPTRDARRLAPDYSAVSEDSPLRVGVKTMGNFSGVISRLGGTSVCVAKTANSLLKELPQRIPPPPNTPSRVGRRVD
jgi:hypothetical protein